MHSMLMLRRRARVTAVLSLMALTAAACGDDDPVEPGDEADTATIRLQIGTQTVNIATSNGAVTGGPVTIPASTATPISATFLRSDGSPDPAVQVATFRLDVTPSTSNITFARTGAFEGTLTGTAAGAGTVQIALFHTVEGHKEYGDFPLAITVQ